MRLALAIALIALGMALMATRALALGVLLCGAAWWVYERAPRPVDDDALVAWVMFLGGIGVTGVLLAGAWQFILRMLP